MKTLETWLAAFFTISIISFMFKDTVLYRVGETILVAVTAANAIITTYSNFLKPTITTSILEEGKYIYLVPLAIGCLCYARFYRPISWLARIPIAFTVGVGISYTLTRQPGVFMDQLTASFVSLKTFNGLLSAVAIVTVIGYFFFMVPEKNVAFKGIGRVGKIFLLVSFGASFASGVMTRISTLLDRMQFLVVEWLHIGI